jgi:hypothetical protein
MRLHRGRTRADRRYRRASQPAGRVNAQVSGTLPRARARLSAPRSPRRRPAGGQCRRGSRRRVGAHVLNRGTHIPSGPRLPMTWLGRAAAWIHVDSLRAGRPGWPPIPRKGLCWNDVQCSSWYVFGRPGAVQVTVVPVIDGPCSAPRELTWTVWVPAASRTRAPTRHPRSRVSPPRPAPDFPRVRALASPSVRRSHPSRSGALATIRYASARAGEVSSES